MNVNIPYLFWQISVYDWKENEIPDWDVRIVETQYAVVNQELILQKL